MDREKVIKDNAIRGLQSAIEISGALVHLRKEHAKAILDLLKEQQQQIWELQDQVEYLTDKLKEHGTEWEHLWDAQDGTFKGRCKKCGFVHFFIEGHDTQYKFCPECGRSVK